MFSRFLCPIAVTSLTIQFALNPLYGQELSSTEVQQLLSWSTEADFAELMQEKIGADLSGQLDFARLSAVAAIPAVNAQALDLDDLANGALIGGLYLGSGSTRLGLPPGAYSVVVQYKSESYTWLVDHFNVSTGEYAGTVLADVRPADAIDGVISYVDHSVCYRADSWVACY